MGTHRLISLIILFATIIGSTHSANLIWRENSGPGVWHTTTNSWLEVNASIPIQDDNFFPYRIPIVGDFVYLTLPGDYQVLLDTEFTDDAREFWIGYPGIEDIETEQVLDLAGELTIGAASEGPICERTRIVGNGIATGTTLGPNYVWIEQRDLSNNAPTFTIGITDPINFIVELWSENGVIYTDPLDFNYTLTDYLDGVILLTYYTGQKISGTALLWIYCSDRRFPVPDAPYTVLFLETPPPTITNCTFNSAGTAIFLNFSIPTDLGGPAFYQDFDCELMLWPQGLLPQVGIRNWLGYGSFCYWTNSYTLVVSLGNNAVPVAGDQIALLGGIISGIPPFETAATLAQTAIIAYPLRIDEPIVLFNMPSVFSLCSGNLTFDISSSYGTGGRNWVNGGVTWALLNASATNFAAIQAVFSATRSEIFQIDSALFNPGEVYQFSATVTNHMRITNTGYSQLTRNPLESMELSLAGAPAVYVNYRTQLSLYSQVSNPCNLAVRSFSFLWSPGNNETLEYIIHNNINTESKNLWLPLNSFQYDFVYIFNLQYTAELVDNRTITLNETIRVVIDPRGDILPIIVSADRKIDSSLSFILDPTYSLDLSGDPSEFTYTWDCTRQTKPFQGNPCLNKQGNLFLAGRVNIPENVFASGLYLFTLVVSKNNGTRTARTTALIEILDVGDTFSTLSLPAVEVALIANPLIAAGSKLELTGTIEPPVSTWYWSVFPPVLDLNDTATFIRLENRFGIVIPEGLLQWGINYEFRLNAWVPEILAQLPGAVSSASVIVKPVIPPTAGLCTATPFNITGLEHLLMFHVKCTQFETSHGADLTSYTFGYVSPLTGRDVEVSLDPRFYSNADISVPFGTTTILVFVRTLIGHGELRLSIPVTVPPLWFPSDPNTMIDPILNTYTAAYSSWGSQEEVIHSCMSCLEWLNYEGTYVDPLTNTSQPLSNIPVVFADSELEIAYRRVRHDAMDSILRLSVPTLTTYSVRTMAEIYATLSTPTSAIDQNLIYVLQRWPFIWDSQLPGVLMPDKSAIALLMGIWNQLMAQQYFTYTPGSHHPLAQALVDLMNLVQLSLQNGMIADATPRTFAWKDVHTTLSFLTASEFSKHTSMSLSGFFVELGSEVPTVYTQAAISSRETQVAWGASILFQNPFIYEQSSQGIFSPIGMVQVIRPEANLVFSVSNLKQPISFSLPQVPVYNPFDLEVDSNNPISCVYWDSNDAFWRTNGLTWIDPNANGTALNVSEGEAYCQSNHLTEFAVRYNLLDVPSSGASSIVDFGWYIFAAVLGILLVLICCLVIFWFFRKRRSEESKEDEFMAPEMVGIHREAVE